ncbi:MAG: hypothetical protein VX143_01050 [Actinomycetota bacterium]|nr:hypothetical protein [Actinomycetota bacterium]
MVEPDIGDDSHLCGHDIGGVVAAEHADLDDRNVDRLVVEFQQRGSGDGLEPGHGFTTARLDRREDGADGLTERVGTDRLATEANAFDDRFEVGAGVGADPKPHRLEQRLH